MTKRITALLCAAALLCVPTGCALPSATEPHEIVFPASQKDRTEYNAAIYDIEPFLLRFRLPKGWTARERESGEAEEFPLVGVFSIMDIYDAQGAHAGAVGYNLCEIYEGEEDNPQALYSQLTVSNHYCFIVQSDTGLKGQNYVPVREDEDFACALAPVGYFPPAAAEEDVTVNKGILARDKTRQVYIAMEFASEALTDEQYIALAQSVSIVPRLPE